MDIDTRQSERGTPRGAALTAVTGIIIIIIVMGTVGLWPGAAAAGGLFIPGLGTQAMGRGGAFAAKADDPSALHHNPAGFARQSGTVVLLGMNLIDFSLAFQREGAYEQAPDGNVVNYAGQPYPAVDNEARPGLGVGSLQAIPLVAVSTDLGLRVDGLRFGLGVMVPNAYPERSFQPDYDFARDEADPDLAPPPQRYDVVRQEAAVVMPSVAASYSIMDRLDVGARASWGVARIEAVSGAWGRDNFEEWVSQDGQFEIEAGDDFVPSYGVGVLYRPAPMLELGLAYASAMTIDAEGTGVALLGSALGLGDEREEIVPINDAPRCAPGGVPGALKACVTLDLPRTATLGGRLILRDGAGRERGDVELDVRWEDWSAASDQSVIVDGRGKLLPVDLEEAVVRHGFRDVLSVRLGGAYAVPVGGSAVPAGGSAVPVGGSAVIIRAGAAYDTATAPDAFQRLDIDGAARATLAGGVAFQTSRLRVELAGGAVIEPDRSAPACNPVDRDAGCPEGSGAAPVSDRAQPDPVQPLFDPDDQSESPFNGGDYASGYLMLSLGVTVWL